MDQDYAPVEGGSYGGCVVAVRPWEGSGYADCVAPLALIATGIAEPGDGWTWEAFWACCFLASKSGPRELSGARSRNLSTTF